MAQQKSVLEILQHQQNVLIRIALGSQKIEKSSLFELHVYELPKFFSKVIEREHPSESINSFITDEANRFFDIECRIKTIPLKEK